MARTKQTARPPTGRPARTPLSPRRLNTLPVCYNLGKGKPYIPTSTRTGQHSQCPKQIANFNGAKDFPHFVKLPCEIQERVWEVLAEEPRVVTVKTETNGGLRSYMPPILHVCSESRAIGLKHYTLAFEPQRFAHRWTDAEQKINGLPPRVYFNFERDTLYFRDNWNENVEGVWCCLSQLRSLVNEGDLKRVTKVGFDVDTRNCSLKTSGENCHGAYLPSWDAIEIMYLGYEDVTLGSDCLISSSKLESEDYKDLMQRCKMNPCWDWLPEDLEREHLKNKVPIRHRGWWKRPDGFLRKLQLVRIKHL